MLPYHDQILLNDVRESPQNKEIFVAKTVSLPSLYYLNSGVHAHENTEYLFQRKVLLILDFRLYVYKRKSLYGKYLKHARKNCYCYGDRI